MQFESETWTMVLMSSALTTCRRWILAIVAMLTFQVTLGVAGIAHATDTVIYTFALANNVCSNLDGAAPKGSLTFANGFLFGSTSSTSGKGNGLGIIFHIDPAGSNYSIDHQFTGAPGDGRDPESNAMTLGGTALYGTTLNGGLNDNGTIFSINDDGTGYASLFSFQKSVLKNKGDQPFSTFALSSGILFGMTSQGGSVNGPVGDGTIFSFDPQTAAYTRLHSFGGPDGSDPHGQQILDPNGIAFYGMTQTGGVHNVGVIYSFSEICSPLNSKCVKTFKVLHNFACPHGLTPACVDPVDGASPDHGTLVQLRNTLFGLTTTGGKFGMGTIFSLGLKGAKKFTVLHSFGASPIDGLTPLGSLMLNGSTLYGTTSAGGSAGFGTVFQINTDGTNYVRLHDFQSGNDGANPADNVILVNNALFGMTEAGGRCNHGVIFSVALP